MLTELLDQILEDPCFNTLRTQEQLGYIVTSGAVLLHGVIGFRVLIQSSKSSSFVEKRIENFLLEKLIFSYAQPLKCNKYFESLSDEEFERNRKALAVRRLEKPKSLQEEFSKYKIEVHSLLYHFDRDNVEAAYLESLSKDDLVTFYKEYILPGAPQRRKVSIHVVPTSQPQAEGQADEVQASEEKLEVEDELDGQEMKPILIQDIADFKKKLPLYPLMEPYCKITMTP